uniref:Tyrosinase copper-binding domain-containing protein n=1 Tax=Bionectria ochroleuca TaxID=29856 RepID=A0A8H7NIK8_BIOOC
MTRRLLTASDWSQDTASVETFLDSPTFDPTTGFGGNGPFVDSSNVNRDFAPQLCVVKLNQAVVDRTMEASKFYEFDRRFQGAIDIEGLTYHGGGHVGIGAELGDISDIYSSPGDPLLFMHHANIDRIWDKWQRKAWSCRKKDIGGPDTGFAYPYNFFAPTPLQERYLPIQDGVLWLGPWGKLCQIQEVMDTRGDKLCYAYQ